MSDPKSKSIYSCICDTDIPDGFENLYDTLMGAFNQAAKAKGKLRHGIGAKSFEEQPIFTIVDQLNKITNTVYGSIGTLYQAQKKINEAVGMMSSDAEKACHELRGSIVYLAATIMQLERK